MRERQELEARLEGISRLKRLRGEERVTFADVADHLVDFASDHPDQAAVIDRRAGFLAEVEQVDHSHRVAGGSTA